MKIRSKALSLVAAVGLTLTAASPIFAETLSLGTVSENVRKHLKRFEPLAGELLVQLADDGITEIEIVVLPTAAAMAEAMRAGQVDLYLDSPLVAAHVARTSNSTPFLRRWKDGVASYHSVIIVRVDSGIETLNDLRGRRIGFQEPDSTSGFMLPVGLIRDQGIPLTELRSRESVPEANELGYVFTGDDNNTLGWMYRGWIDAAATDPGAWEQLSQAAPDEFRIIARSIEVPRQTVIRRNDIDPVLVERLTEVFSSLHETEHGREILTQFNDTTQFDLFPDGVEATFEPIYDLLDELVAQGLI